ncbi:hypothetical protein GOBAR_DD33462 [Gossypium barbadense]|nr:hypothetical protein GOBAR_DD33462 [Gossypium barbadense]
MYGLWGFERLKLRMMVVMLLMLVLSLFEQNMSFSSRLNSEVNQSGEQQCSYELYFMVHLATIPVTGTGINPAKELWSCCDIQQSGG